MEPLENKIIESEVDCSESHDFACIRERTPSEVTIGGFGGRRSIARDHYILSPVHLVNFSM